MCKSNKAWLTLLLILLTFTVSGCWDRRELENLGVVVGVGIDTDERKNVILTTQILNPKALSPSTGGSTPGPEPVVLVKSKGASVFEAIRNSTLTSSRRLYWPHNKVIVISQKAARSGVQPFLDLFIRDAESRINVWILISKSDTSKMMQVSGDVERIPSLALDKIILDYGSTSKLIPTQVIDFINYLLSKTRAPVAPEIDIQETDGKKHFIMIGTAVFKRDKLVGELNPIETRGLLWVLGKVKSGIIVVYRDKRALASLEILEASRYLRPVIEDNHITMNVDIKTVLEVGQIQAAEEFTTPQKLHELETLCSRAIKDEVTRTVNVAKKLNADIFGFGDALSKSNPEEFKDLEARWNTVFRQIDINIKINTRIRYVGHTAKTLLYK